MKAATKSESRRKARFDCYVRACRVRFRVALLLTAISTGLCSCSASKQAVTTNPFPIQSDHTNNAAALPEIPGTGNTITQVGYEVPPRDLSSASNHSSATNHADAVSMNFTPAEPRVPILTTSHEQPSGDPNQVPQGSSEEFPDEYLFDGGDRAMPYHYEADLRAGLETEDTVVEFSDHRGAPQVKFSNRVAVYAPRFGAVRTVSTVESGVAVDKAVGAKITTPGAGLRNLVASSEHAQRDMLDSVRMRSRVSGLDSDALKATVGQRTTPTSHVKLLNVFEDLTFVRGGQLSQSDQARLANGIQAASQWTHDGFPVVLSTSDKAQVVDVLSRPLGMVGREDQRKPGDLRIVKLADKKVAKPGDEITFTIRYDNLGDRELKDIRVIDNLTPRLEYIPDSATSDRAGELLVADNNEGSLILTFEVAEPLPGGEGGVITFKTLVK